MMKKATRKLGIRRETLRVLAELDLVYAAAGGPNVQMDTGADNRTCVAALALADAVAGLKA